MHIFSLFWILLFSTVFIQFPLVFQYFLKNVFNFLRNSLISCNFLQFLVFSHYIFEASKLSVLLLAISKLRLHRPLEITHVATDIFWIQSLLCIWTLITWLVFLCLSLFFIIFPAKRRRYHLIGLFILWLYLLSSQFGLFLATRRQRWEYRKK